MFTRNRVMQSINLASYALVAAIGVSAVVGAISDNAVASPAPVAGDAASLFVKNAPKQWLICNGADSDANQVILKVKFSSVSRDGLVVSTKTLDNQSNEDVLLKRTDNDPELVTFGTVQRYSHAKAVTNLVSYGQMNESMLATTVYNSEDNAVYTIHINLANCIGAK
jgi:hypothetical protein